MDSTWLFSVVARAIAMSFTPRPRRTMAAGVTGGFPRIVPQRSNELIAMMARLGFGGHAPVMGIRLRTGIGRAAAACPPRLARRIMASSRP